MKKKVHLIFFCLFSAAALVAQNSTVDSLKAEIKKTDDPKSKAVIAIAISEELMGVSAEESLLFIDQALETSRALGDVEMTGECLAWKGRLLGENNQLDEAMQCFDEAEALCSNPVDSILLSEIFNGKGIIYKYKNDFENALKYQYRSAAIYEKLENFQSAATTYNSIANLHTLLDNFPKAIEFYEKSIRLLKANGSRRALAGAYLNLANALNGDLEKKLGIYAEAEKIAAANDYYRLLSYIYAGKADFYENDVVDIDSAKIFYQLAIQNAELSGDPYMMAYNLMYLGILELDQNPAAAEKTILALLENNYVQGDVYLKAEGNYYLSKSLFLQGKYPDAYVRLDTAMAKYKTMFNEETANAIADADAKYEISKKEAQLARQQLEIAEQKNRQNGLIVGGLALLALMAGLFQYFFYKQKRKKREVEIALETEVAETKRLLQLDELKTRFFTNVSHEFRTPLTLITGPLEEALKKGKHTPLEADLRLAHRNSKQLLGLVNEVLDLSKMEAGKMETELSETELVPLLRRVFSSFRSGADRRGVELDFGVDLPENLVVKTDIPKLETILKNLISNALKFTEKGGKVQLVAGGKGFPSFQNLESLSLTVSDTGRGIHPDDLPHVFDRFFQSKKGNGNTASGTGIGLALAKQMAGLLGGDLSVESEVGKGSRFTLTLPLRPANVGRAWNSRGNGGDAKNPAGKARISRPLRQAGNTLMPNIPISRPRLLIVEDNHDMGQYLKNALSENYDCTVAIDGVAALELLSGSPALEAGQEGAFDLITSDVMMPNMDGFALREKINERPEWQNIPFILLTARTLEEDKLRGFRLGIDDYITKPFSMPELEARIRNLLANRKLRDDSAGMENLTSDERLLHDAKKLVLEKMKDPQFSVEMMARGLGYSQRHLSRVFGKLAGLTPVKFILEIRLQQARQLLESKRFATVSEVRNEVGIATASYFTKKFTERFGKNPTAYLGEDG